MIDVNDYIEEKSCIYKDEEYLVRDNGAVLRKSRPNRKARKHDNEWTFGNKNNRNGYSFFFGTNIRVHQIVATAFHGEQPTKEHIVDHIDTNRQNNRPDNLRWITKLENVVLNEATRKKIEYRTGVNIYDFLENPSAYRDVLDAPDFSWMRRVTEEEAKACLENIKCWTNSKPKFDRSDAKIGEWIFSEKNSNIIDSLTPLAKQRDWKTLAKFVCCPNEVEGDPILCYFKNLSDGAIFSKNRYGNSLIVKYALADNCIFLVTTMASGPKGWALIKVTFEDGYYIHESIRSFFTEEGAEKHFTLAQGLEWTGGNSIDDYC